TKAMRQLVGRNVDILGYDACLMGMIEVAYETKGSTDYVVFSEEAVPGKGFPYDVWLGLLAANPDMSPSDAAKKLTEAYVTSYIGSYSKATFAAVDQSKFDSFIPLFNDFTGLIQNQSLKSICTDSAKNSQSFLKTEYKDLYDFIRELKTRIKDGPILVKADQVLSALKDGTAPLIISSGNTGGPVAKAEGLSIYIPGINKSSRIEYRTLKFGRDTRWPDFIESLNHKTVPSPAFDTAVKIRQLLALEKQLSAEKNADRSTKLGYEIEQLIELVESCVIGDINSGNPESASLLNSDSVAIRIVHDDIRQYLKNSLYSKALPAYDKSLSILN
ncbi:MAG: clostripain-related cysteine peptidase, partial [Candidatus Wallbacteria bacterium]|nr:clostripain-related cysteine peptidase [Candidatus Wallbacteria bacterium]